MVQLMLVYFGLGIVVNLPALTAGMIAVSLNSTAYVAEVIRGGINSVDEGQVEAAQSLGLNYQDRLRFVVLPQALKNIWPALGNEFISLIKESSIVSIIGVTDLIYQLKIVQSVLIGRCTNFSSDGPLLRFNFLTIAVIKILRREV